MNKLVIPLYILMASQLLNLVWAESVWAVIIWGSLFIVTMALKDAVYTEGEKDE